jgi:hypothetical protein
MLSPRRTVPSGHGEVAFCLLPIPHSFNECWSNMWQALLHGAGPPRVSIPTQAGEAAGFLGPSPESSRMSLTLHALGLSHH